MAKEDPHNVHREEQRRILAAKRRLLEREVTEYLAVKNDETSGKGDERQKEDFTPINASTKATVKKELKSLSDDDDGGYEEICFQKENHYLTPLTLGGATLKRMGRKSISDSDLLLMDENKEIELLCDDRRETTTERTFTYSEPEQGFYRVYDDLDRVREWDLIPYVITRKMKEAQRCQEKESKVEKKTTTDLCSRVSLDSGRASVVSSLSCKTNQKRQCSAEETGSNCSTDSGTYNVFDDNAAVLPPPLRPRSGSEDFVAQVYHQLNSLRGLKPRELRQPKAKRRVPPPPPTAAPKSTLSSLQPLNYFFDSSPSPPPLPPRHQKEPRRRNLSKHFGLLEEERHLSEAAVHSVALQNLSDVSLRSNLSELSPGKKDLSKYLGIEAVSPSSSSSTLTQQTSFILRRLKSCEKGQKSGLPHNNVMSSVEKPFVAAESTCRRGLQFDTTNAVANSQKVSNDVMSSQVSASAAMSKTIQTLDEGLVDGPEHKSRRRRSVTRIFRKTPLLVTGSRRARSRERNTAADKKSQSPSARKLRSATTTPVRRFKSKEPRRSFMATLLQSNGKKEREISFSDGEEKENERDYTPDIREAKRRGMPVIPFLQTPSSCKDETANCEKSAKFLCNNNLPGEKQCETSTPRKSSNGQKTEQKMTQQQSSLYLTMNAGVQEPSLAVQALATPAGSSRYLFPHHLEDQQHCASCTCRRRRLGDRALSKTYFSSTKKTMHF